MASFGRYEILDKLGEGAMGVVYRARDGALGRVVALKMLSSDVDGHDELHQRFQREAEAIGRLNHPNIVTVYDLGSVEGHLYMAMELLDGEDLRAVIERRTEVPLPDRVRLMIQICEGLNYAHSRGVIHRDVKPANVLVTSDARVKILDFGLARVTTRQTITRKGMIMGTPDYMSPEQAMGRPVDRRSDIFSAGGMFYEFLAGQKPFMGRTLHAVLYQIVQEEPEPLLTLNPELPARLVAVVDRMLRKDPERRFATMEEAGRALREVYEALRRSRGRSALPVPPMPVNEEGRARVREHVGRGRAAGEAGQPQGALTEFVSALAIDPNSDDAAEGLWRAVRALDQARPRQAPDPTIERRVVALLARAAPGKAEADARAALAELALIAPDDHRIPELLRARAGKK